MVENIFTVCHITLQISVGRTMVKLVHLVTTVVFLVQRVYCYDASEFTNEMTKLHNKARMKQGAANMNKLAANEKLAVLAQSWADKCTYSHGNLQSDEFSDVGQNIYVTSANKVTAFSVLAAWMSEKKNYNFKTMECSKVCGHYLQAVWADSAIIGCAYKYCDKIKGGAAPKGYIVVCDYAPGGNYPDTDPYMEGNPCDNCLDSCSSGLCEADYEY